MGKLQIFLHHLCSNGVVDSGRTVVL